MSDKVKKEEELEEQAAEAADAPDAAEQLQEELAKAYEELAAANDKYLRLYAEYDNYRKRSDKEKSGIYASAYADAVKDILPIGDNLARASVFTDPESVKKGMAMILKGFDEALKKMGITEIAVKEGDAFDPELHNAVMHVEDENYGESVVVEVLQKGYQYGDRVIRYAMVKVAN
ncbi:MAG: nucleotide exchange factor GrpE [Clostridia bacterium]|nr:nucleotide exchange factor GrpE [Clostridia bacterium]